MPWFSAPPSIHQEAVLTTGNGSFSKCVGHDIDSRPRKMKKPKKRPLLPARRSNNEKRRLMANPDPIYIGHLQRNITYKGSPKHKKHPHLYSLPPFQGDRGDATLCDRDAGFLPADFASMRRMIHRGLQTGLVGENGIIWSVSDNGWIYEARATNLQQSKYHGYPVRNTETIAERVYRRFRGWAQSDATAWRDRRLCDAGHVMDSDHE